MEFNISDTESIRRAAEAAQNRVLSEGMPELKDGEVFSAQITQLEGNALTLRIDDGRVVRATLQGDMIFAQGDIVEASVSKSGEYCVLYMLNISHTSMQNTESAAQTVPQNVISGMMSVLRRNPGMDAGVAMFFTENNIADTAENISAFTMLSQGVGVSSLLGRILGAIAQPDGEAQFVAPPAAPESADSSAPGTSGSVQAKSGEGIAQGASTDALPGSTVWAESFMETVNTPMGGTQAYSMPVQHTGGQMQFGQDQAQNIQTQSGPDLAGAEQTPVKAAAQTQFTLAQTGIAQAQIAPAQERPVRTEPAPVQSGGAPQAEAEAVKTSGAGLIVKIPAEAKPENAGFQNATGKPQQAFQYAEPATVTIKDGTVQNEQGVLMQSAAPQKENTTPSGSGVEKTATGTNQALAGDGKSKVPEDNARIEGIIRNIFIRPDAQTGVSVKKSVDELPQTIRALKSAMVQSDINNKEVCIKCTDHALRQLELSDRTVPFEYMQIPVDAHNGAYQTAELFVFRRQGKQNTAGDAGFTILVALDTQHIGRVETLIKETGGSVSLEFRLEQLGTMEMFKRNENTLKDSVEAAGYRLTGLRYAGLDVKTSVLNAAESAGMDVGAAKEGIDVRI